MSDWRTIDKELQSGELLGANLQKLWDYRRELESKVNAGDPAFQKKRESLLQTVCDLIKKKEAEESEKRAAESAGKRHDEIAALNKKAIEVSEEAVKVSKSANVISEKANAISREASFYSKIALYVAVAALVISGLQFILDWKSKPATTIPLAHPTLSVPETKSETPPSNSVPSSISISTNTTSENRQPTNK